ncbi:hypothetical protein KLP28_04790 [Nocardioidaceae bacterium]|nr:hypothetical protein KLP28_04790 [Nocardioidaceae bacterium]
MSRTVSRRLSALVALPLAAALLTACGGDEDAETTPSTVEETNSMGGMTGMTMNDPTATAADELPGAALRTGEFAVLDTAPPGSEGVSGTSYVATEAPGAPGTTWTVRLAGLQPDTEYVGHLHEQACGDDAGGDHFKFDPAGSDVPPNEVHIGFTTDSEGNGEATVTNETAVGDGVKASVIHPAAAMDNKLACADL